jgi:hypothetical protein
MMPICKNNNIPGRNRGMVAWGRGKGDKETRRQGDKEKLGFLLQK